MDYAIIRTGGFQFKVEEAMRLKVPRLEAQVGEEVQLGEVLMVSTGTGPRLGRPRLDGVRVVAQVLGHGREEKVIVYKYKRRKKYRRKKGHRQSFTELLIKTIHVPGD